MHFAVPLIVAIKLIDQTSARTVFCWMVMLDDAKNGNVCIASNFAPVTCCKGGLKADPYPCRLGIQGRDATPSKYRLGPVQGME